MRASRYPARCRPSRCRHKNRASNYRVVLNEKRDYDGRDSKPTSRRYAASRLKGRQGTALSTAVACPEFNSGVLKPAHVDQVRREKEDNGKKEVKKNEKHAAPTAGKGARKHRGQKNGGDHQQKAYQKLHNGHPHQRPHRDQYAYSTIRAPQTLVRTSSTPLDGSHVADIPPSQQNSNVRSSTARSMPSFKAELPVKNGRERKVRHRTEPTEEPPKIKPSLIPSGRTGHSSRGVAGRTSYPRLKGADLYVARLGNGSVPNTPRHQADDWEMAACAASSVESSLSELSLLGENQRSNSPDSSSASSACSFYPPPSGSLHEELTCNAPSPNDSTTTLAAAAAAAANRPVVQDSHPCYRCITYMHVVGIKRVFWTNERGEWEGGKVRDMVDGLDKLAEVGKAGADESAEMNGVFVTKHEVLMLRRMMGQKKDTGK